MGLLNQKEINSIGFKKVGENVSISDKASFYNPDQISIGSNVRIDDFCILSGEIILESYIHISAYSALYGKFGIHMQSFTGLSPRSMIFSASDDFSGNYLISPMVPRELSKVVGGKVLIKSFAHVCANSIVMPDLTIHEGAVIGAMSLLKENAKAWSVYGGCPAKIIKAREKGMLSKANSLEPNF